MGSTRVRIVNESVASAASQGYPRGAAVLVVYVPALLPAGAAESRWSMLCRMPSLRCGSVVSSPLLGSRSTSMPWGASSELFLMSLCPQRGSLAYFALQASTALRYSLS